MKDDHSQGYPRLAERDPLPRGQSEGRIVSVLGWTATIGSMAMYFAYIDQISRNLAGMPGSVIQPAATCVACSMWASYGFLKRSRDWPIVCANIPGVILSAVTVLTAW